MLFQNFNSHLAKKNATETESVSLYDFLIYAFAFSATLLAAFLFYSHSHYLIFKPAPGGDKFLVEKVMYYKRHSSEFDTVFLGDSRTYCGIHPEMLDPLINTRSINLAIFAHWFPTQFPMIRDIVNYIPSDTTVVWSIGHQNFYRPAEVPAIQAAYPVGWFVALRYLTMGVPLSGLADNLTFYTPWLRLFVERANIRRNLSKTMRENFSAYNLAPVPFAHAERLHEPQIPRPKVSASLTEDIARQYEGDAQVVNVKAIDDHGQLTSVVLYLLGGGYYRIELDYDYFRKKQMELGWDLGMAPPEYGENNIPPAGAGYIRLFEEFLDLFHEHGINLVINELEEAPFRYRNPTIRKRFREFMRYVIQPKVELRGFKYIRTNIDELDNDDYFDYNHLNSRGIRKYTPMLAKELETLATGR